MAAFKISVEYTNITNTAPFLYEHIFESIKRLYKRLTLKGCIELEKRFEHSSISD